MATLVQDVWLGADPRLRARRFAPYEEAAVRVVFHPDLGETLDDPLLAGFLEQLATRVEVIAYEPRGQGGSAGRFGPVAADDLRALIDDLPRRWHRGLRVVVAGHGLGAWMALGAADAPGVTGVLALGPVLRPSSLDAGAPASPLGVPAFVIDGREQEGGDRDAVAAWVAGEPQAAHLRVPGDHRAPLASPWAEMAAAWTAERAAAR
jgi:alpha-beta hydrolase superfamily lysophospholipase